MVTEVPITVESFHEKAFLIEIGETQRPVHLV
jgi:hypothetical protein